MFDPKLYREACRELKAPERKIEEIIAMTEKTSKKKIRPLRTALVAAAAVAMMVVGVSAANPEMMEAVTMRVAEVFRVDDYRMDLTTEDGEKVSVYSFPEAAVENRNGRTILVLGEDEVDITDTFKETGKYTYENTSGESQITAVVEGTVDEWTIALKVGGSGEDAPVHIFSSTMDKTDISGEDGVTYTWNSASTNDNTYVSSFQYDGETVAAIPTEK